MLPPRSAAVAIPYAERLQGSVSRWDYVLQAMAIERRPGVRWWWGVRTAFGIRYAFCYICGAGLIRMTAGADITQTSRDVILLHRDTHRDGRNQPSGNDAPGTSPGAVTHGQEADR